MGIIRRNTKGSDSIIQNSQKWNLLEEGTQSVRSEYDFSQFQIQQAPEQLNQEQLGLARDNKEEHSNSTSNEEPKEKVKKPWIKLLRTEEQYIPVIT